MRVGPRVGNRVIPAGEQTHLQADLIAAVQVETCADARFSIILLRFNKALGRGRTEMRKPWKKPKIVEVAVGMEINCYACADL